MNLNERTRWSVLLPADAASILHHIFPPSAIIYIIFIRISISQLQALGLCTLYSTT